MTVRALTNERWGFESSCFVCEPANPGGLRIPFFHDDAGDGRVFAEFTLDRTFSGAPAYVHGGVTLAILDEAVAWAAIALAGKLAVTHTTSTTFERPVKVGSPYRVEATVSERTVERVGARAQVLDEHGTVRASAVAELVVLGEAHAADAIGAPVTGEVLGFLR